MKLSRFFAAALLLSFVLAGCSKEAKIGKKLAGTWDVTSYTIDGVESMGSVFSSVELFFGTYNKKDRKGDYTFTAVDALGQTTVEKGTYSLNDTGEEVTFTADSGGDDSIFMLTLDGDNLEMETTTNGYKIILQAKRK